MDLQDAVKARHSVRSYTDRKIEGDILNKLLQAIDECNKAGGLSIRLCLNEPSAFSGLLARYGKFNNVKNYIALVGKKSDGLYEKCGYYGEKIVLEAQRLGLNTCWVAATYNKSKSKTVIGVKPDEKLLMLIAVGYGETGGVSRKTKTAEELCRVNGTMPDWFRNGMEAAQLAPTAMNQQKFSFELDGNKIKASAGSGFYTKVDLGIAKYNFEAGAGKGEWEWA